MDAVQIRNFGPPQSHSIEVLPRLLPGPGQVVIEVKTATVNYPDLLVISGRYQTKLPTPFVPGKEAAGVVCRIGENVERVKIGDRVLIHVESGAYATEAIAREDQCMPLPDEMNFIDAATLGLAAQTAWFALLERGAWQTGDTVLINGATGAVGHAAVQIANAHGATVFAGANSVARAEAMLVDLPCSIIDLGAPDLHNSLREQVHTATRGAGADVVIDTLGGDVFNASLRALAWCGRIITVGFASGRIPEVKANYLLVKNISALGLQWSDYRDLQPQKVAKAHAGLTALWESGKLQTHIAQTLPICNFSQALQLLETRSVMGRIVLTMD
jgi:NADPH2:quinone reductase